MFIKIPIVKIIDHFLKQPIPNMLLKLKLLKTPYREPKLISILPSIRRGTKDTTNKIFP